MSSFYCVQCESGGALTTASESVVVWIDRLQYATVNIGTPSKAFFVILDTGSDLLWVPCANCISCSPTAAPAFEPIFVSDLTCFMKSRSSSSNLQPFFQEDCDVLLNVLLPCPFFSSYVWCARAQFPDIPDFHQWGHSQQHVWFLAQILSRTFFLKSVSSSLTDNSLSLGRTRAWVCIARLFPQPMNQSPARIRCVLRQRHVARAQMNARMK